MFPQPSCAAGLRPSSGTRALPAPVRLPALVARGYRSGCWLVIEAAGEVDVEAVPQLHRLLAGDLSHVVFDLRRVSFIDASGLGVLAECRRHLGRGHGSVRVAGPSPQVRRLLAMTSIDRAVTVFESFDEAIAGHAWCSEHLAPVGAR